MAEKFAIGGPCAGLNCDELAVVVRKCLTLGCLVEIPLCAECDALEQAGLERRAAESGIAVVDPRNQ